MYCSTMRYDCPVTATRRLRIAYNNSLRKLLGIYQSTTVQVKCLYSLTLNHFGELLKSYIHNFINRLQCSNNLNLSSIYESTVPIYSNIWTWWYDMVIL